jgi:hypothetical protein
LVPGKGVTCGDPLPRHPSKKVGKGWAEVAVLLDQVTGIGRAAEQRQQIQSGTQGHRELAGDESSVREGRAQHLVAQPRGYRCHCRDVLALSTHSLRSGYGLTVLTALRASRDSGYAPGTRAFRSADVVCVARRPVRPPRSARAADQHVLRDRDLDVSRREPSSWSTAFSRHLRRRRGFDRYPDA